MSNVTLDIAGRRYTIACAAGEEAHVGMLGASINARLASLPNVAGQSEPRTLLYAALLLADELHEARKAAQPVERTPEMQQAQAEPLENLAERLESLAAKLEQAGATP
jgi:cell division protein ZapA